MSDRLLGGRRKSGMKNIKLDEEKRDEKDKERRIRRGG